MNSSLHLRRAGLAAITFLMLLFILITACETEDPVETFSASITLSSSSTTLAEDVGNVTITVALSQENSSGSAIGASYTIGGTATNGTDFSGLNGSITIPNGSRNATATLNITDDEAFEGNETIELTLDDSGLPEGISLGTNTQLTLTIQDNDALSVSVTANDATALEGDNDGEFTINLSAANTTGSAVTFNYNLQGTATSGEDYTALSGSVEIAADATSATIAVEVTDDDAVEESETVILRLTEANLPEGFSLGTREATVTIEDNDEEAFTAEAAMTATDDEASEDGDGATFLVSLDKANDSGAAMALNYTISGTATNGEDYTSLSGTVSIAEGETSAEIAIEVTDDETVEAAETVILTLSTDNLPDGISLADNSEATVTITDNDEMTFSAAASVAATTAEAAEGGSNAVFTVSLDNTNNSGAELSLQYALSGTATNGEDYASLSGSVSIAEGESSATITIEVIDDSAVEDAETVIITLSSDNQPEGITLSDNNTATATITDNDEAFAATVSLTVTDAEASEDGDNATFLVSLDKSNDSGGDLTFAYSTSGTATNGTDYTSLSGAVVIAEGETSTEITLEVTDDSEVEEAETVILSLDTNDPPEGISVSSENSATATITDNDEAFSATVSLTSTDNSATEGSDDATFTISLDKENSSGAAFSIPYTIAGTAINGTDYTNLSGTIEIASGSTSVTITVDVTDDTDDENDETVILSLDASNLPSSLTTGTSTSVTITIVDNDETAFTAEASITTSTATGQEGGTNLSFTISLDKTNTSGAVIAIPYSLSGDAINGTDYTSLSGSIDIAENSSSASLEIVITDDSEAELDEDLTVTLSGTLPDGVTFSANSSTATGTIEDNEMIDITFGTNSGNGIAISSWTSVSGADGYVIIMNSSNSFTDPGSGSSTPASTSYRGYDQQVVFDGIAVSSLDLSLLASGQSYYFKVYPYKGSKVYVTDYTEDSSESTACTTTSTSTSEVCFSISGDERKITSNQYPDHATGSFPNADVTATALDRTVDLTPTLADAITYVYNETSGPSPSNKNFYNFGVASNGLGFNPMGLKPWSVVDASGTTTGEENWEWQSKVTDEGETHLDEYGAHVTSQGKYHYHGDAKALASGEDGSKHSLIYGFAADGFPIYYKYGYTDKDDYSSAIKELNSSYQLKSGSRTGDGETAPNGDYDGTYIQDYEYVSGLGDLDECNGRYGVTPEFPEGTYFYVITSEFPKVSNCFKGTPSSEFIIGN